MLLLLFIYILICNSFKHPVQTMHLPGKKHPLPLYWKISKTSSITRNPQKIILDGEPICIYRNNDNTVVAISDVCLHRGASLSQGKRLQNNCIQCPYHGWEYKEGVVNNIPGCPEKKPRKIGVPRYSTYEVNDDVYIQPIHNTNSSVIREIYNESSIYVPPEAKNNNFTRISGSKHISHPASLITENVLDMMHISFVHSFGNTMSPVPFDIIYKDINEYSGKTLFHYTAGPTSIASILGNEKFVTVENEFYLPDTTVTRVKANDMIIKTIVTHCRPINDNESLLNYDLYRNFLKAPVFDILFNQQMELTLKEDISILDKLYEEYSNGILHTKFDITQLKYRSKKKNLAKLLSKRS